MNLVAKQQSDALNALTTVHRRQVRDLEDNLERGALLCRQHESDIAALSLKLSDAHRNAEELDGIVRREPERQQEAVRLALVWP